MSKVIDFNLRKNNSNNLNEQVCRDYEEVKNELSSKLKDPKIKIVARSYLEARVISKIMMENDPDIHYCKHIECISRKSVYLEIVPVYKSDIDIIFASDDLKESYVEYLKNNDLIEITDDDIVILKD